METQHAAWLRQLAVDQRGGITLPAITRGEEYVFAPEFLLDVTGSTFTLAIRLAPDAIGAALAEVTGSLGTWDGIAQPVTFRLPDSTPLPADGDANGLAEVVFEVNQDGKRLFAGNIPISGAV